MTFGPSHKLRINAVTAAGQPVAISVTHVDGLVLARTIFNHSVNYRSAVLFGHGRLLSDPDYNMRLGSAAPVPLVGHRIGGRIETAGTRTSPVFNPATGETIASTALADAPTVKSS